MGVHKILHLENEDFASQASQFLMKWTPRIVVAAIAGYYCLGVAYEWGIMAAIDKVAISILKDSVGYAGIGAVMPTFQWYAAWGVRTVSAAGAGVLYDIAERTVLYVYHLIRDRYYGPGASSTTLNAHSPTTSLPAWIRI